jgi:hypothetical protein
MTHLGSGEKGHCEESTILMAVMRYTQAGSPSRTIRPTSLGLVEGISLGDETGR